MKLTRRELCSAALLAGLAPASAALAQTLNAPRAASDPKRGQRVLTFLHTNDPHGRVYYPDESFGLTRIATMVRRVRAEMPNVMLLEAGDLIHGTPQEKAFEGHPIIDSMNALGYDVATAGNHEFDFGQRIAKQAISLAKFPILSANVLDAKTGTSWGGLKPYIVREIAGLRVAIFGMTTVGTVKIQFPRTLEGINIVDPIPIARELVPRLREQERADVVVFLSHLGYKPDREFAEQVSGVDLILGGHTHTRLDEQVWVNGTLIQQTGAHSHALGRVDVLVERDTAGKALLTVNGRDGRWWGRDGVPAPLGATYPAGPLTDPTKETPHDNAVKAAYLPYWNDLNLRRAEVLTTTQIALPADDITKRPTPLGRLMASAVKRKFGTEIALVPSGMIGQGFKAGPITVGDARDTVGGYTRQHIVTARVSGARLRELCGKLLRTGAHQMQTAGLIQNDDQSLTVNSKPLQDERVYSVAGSAYLIQDNLLGHEGVTIVDDDPEAATTRDSLVELLRGYAPLAPTSPELQV